MDIVCNASITEVVSCFENHSIFQAMIQSCTAIKYLQRRGEANALVHMVNGMPWPMCNRDLVFHYAGVADYKNHGFLTVSKSLPPNYNYFDVIIPEAEIGSVRMDFKYMYNYF